MSTGGLTVGLTPARRRQLGRRAQRLAGASVAYNLIEAAVAVGFGVVAGSVALVGFGLDSLVEVSSGLVILWQFRRALPETRERQALRLIAMSFFALAIYVTVSSARTLLGAREPATSVVGIAVAAVSLVVMPFLSFAQRRTGRALGSGAWSPTPSRPCCAPTCRESCLLGCCSMRSWGGGGQTRLPGW